MISAPGDRGARLDRFGGGQQCPSARRSTRRHDKGDAQRAAGALRPGRARLSRIASWRRRRFSRSMRVGVLARLRGREGCGPGGAAGCGSWDLLLAVGDRRCSDGVDRSMSMHRGRLRAARIGDLVGRAELLRLHRQQAQPVEVDRRPVRAAGRGGSDRPIRRAARASASRRSAISALQGLDLAAARPGSHSSRGRPRRPGAITARKDSDIKHGAHQRRPFRWMVAARPGRRGSTGPAGAAVRRATRSLAERARGFAASSCVVGADRLAGQQVKARRVGLGLGRGIAVGVRPAPPERSCRKRLTMRSSSVGRSRPPACRRASARARRPQALRPVRRIRRSPRCGSPGSCGSRGGFARASGAAGSARRSRPAAACVVIGATRPRRDDGPRDPARGALLAVVIQDVGQRRPPTAVFTRSAATVARLAHPHVQRAVLHEGKAALGLVELHRATRRGRAPRRRAARPPAGRGPRTCPATRRQPVAVGGRPGLRPSRRPAGRGRCRSPVGARLEQPARIAARAEGAVEPDARDRRDGRQERAQQDRNMGAVGRVAGQLRCHRSRLRFVPAEQACRADRSPRRIRPRPGVSAS